MKKLRADDYCLKCGARPLVIEKIVTTVNKVTLTLKCFSCQKVTTIRRKIRRRK